MLALPTEEAKGLRGVAGSPAARSLGISLPVGLQQCGPGGSGQSGQSLPQRCLARVRAGENRCKLEKHIPRAIPAGLQAAACSQPETVNKAARPSRSSYRHEITAATANPRSSPPPALAQSGSKGAGSQSCE